MFPELMELLWAWLELGRAGHCGLEILSLVLRGMCRMNAAHKEYLQAEGDQEKKTLG